MSRNPVTSLAVIFLISFSVSAAQPVLILDVPRGGEVYSENSTQLIRLNPKTRLKSVLLEVSRDNGATFTAIGTIDNKVKDRSKRNVFLWSVPGPASATALIRASGKTPKATVSVTSGGFIIGTPQFSVVTAPGTVTSTELADGSVTTPKLADAAVTNAKLAPGAVTVDKISSGPVSSNFVLTADGLGGVSFSAAPAASAILPSAGNSIISALNDPATTGTINAGILSGTAPINITGNAATATTATGVTPAAGNSVVAALNDPATTPGTLDADILTGTASIDITGNAATATTATVAATVASTSGNSVITALNKRNVERFKQLRIRPSSEHMGNKDVDADAPFGLRCWRRYSSQSFDGDVGLTECRVIAYKIQAETHGLGKAFVGAQSTREKIPMNGMSEHNAVPSSCPSRHNLSGWHLPSPFANCCHVVATLMTMGAYSISLLIAICLIDFAILAQR